MTDEYSEKTRRVAQQSKCIHCGSLKLFGDSPKCSCYTTEAIVARAEASNVAAQSAPQEVDPRTLPVGAVYHHRGFKYRWLVVAPGFARYEDKLGSEATPVGLEKVVLISLPPVEVELGTLATDEHFKLIHLPPGFAPAWLGALLRVVSASKTLSVSVVIAKPNASGYISNGVIPPSTRVLRVPAPSSAIGIDPAVPGSERTVEATYCDGKLVKVDERKPAPPPKPETKPKRWQTDDVLRIAALDAQLAQQVASGGQDCKAARSLIERADRLRREAADKEATARAYRQEGCIRYGMHNRWLGEQEKEGRPGIASLRLERPLIPWRRK